MLHQMTFIIHSLQMITCKQKVTLHRKENRLCGILQKQKIIKDNRLNFKC